MKKEEIINLLPYQNPFLFVDEIESISENGVIGRYTFKEDETFYKGHFKSNPITPGVILTECMAQIGLVCLGIYLLSNELNENVNPQIALTSHQMDFYLPVLPKERVTVISEKEMFRFNKLKCKVKMLNEEQELVARGVISGMLKV
ncbi:3-hydroxyacyl-ACP dehydratase FabZ family protein [Winogradskyella luteola]|uniref:Hydroxymyristoyl-ACP dehydratase n=1 Tax=Winogradskyella luteola TaxID=2828330 RepID=A0A9X1JPU3_9FLAO|nr:FabA/FabZ family ACP-dehydratase [Winogradskyella luteola]MBV7269049.1 hydroxymyristoyl-ACP dehydratase [Winogradskyella luteola]